jgi:hypothetical protein
MVYGLGQASANKPYTNLPIAGMDDFLGAMVSGKALEGTAIPSPSMEDTGIGDVSRDKPIFEETREGKKRKITENQPECKLVLVYTSY